MENSIFKNPLTLIWKNFIGFTKKKHGFQGMLGSLDCMDWEWDLFNAIVVNIVDMIMVQTHGYCWKLLSHKSYGYDLIFFDVLCGNDINVIHQSHLFSDLKDSNQRFPL